MVFSERPWLFEGIVKVGSSSAELIVYRIAQVHNTLVSIPMKEDSAIEEIFGRLRLFKQGAYGYHVGQSDVVLI